MKMPIDPAGDVYAPTGARIPALFTTSLSRPRIWIGIWTGLAVVITVLYLLPNAGPPGQAHLDKVAHLIAFGSIGFAAVLASARRWMTVPFLISIVLAMILEWLQSYVPGREYSIFDWAANLVGLSLGIAAALVARRLTAPLGPSA
jgi:VanZ family protein